MRYWELSEGERVGLSVEQVDQLARQQSAESGDPVSGEHIREDWWNRRARVYQRKQIAESALFFSRITNGDETLVRQCLEHTYSPRQLESIQ